MKRIPITNAVFVGLYSLDQLMTSGFAARVTPSDGVRSTYEQYERKWKSAKK